ncbi:MAG: competence/damage-inducible protein A [Bacteroidales bacterium]|nr:competence/damage-inducible protein A [Bacteroidales bacterium]
MKAEIISIGDELLIGQVVNTNASWMAKKLNDAGIPIHQITVIPDQKERIVTSLEEALKHVDLVIFTGGLGPTRDDITKLTLCEFFKSRLVLNDDVLSDIHKLFGGRGLDLNELNRKQAEVPDNCIPIRNKNGTAPGMWFEQNGKIVVSLPGVPYEMEPMIADFVIPEISKKFSGQAIIHRTVLTQGIPESRLAKLIEDWEDNLPQNIKLAYLPKPGIVRLRLSAIGKSKPELEAQIDSEIKKLKKIIPKAIFGFDDDELGEVVGWLLRNRGQTISTAESCTGGYIAHLITSITGSSAYYKGSVVAYANEIKENMLGVSGKDLENFGAVSEEVVIQMAEGVKNRFQTDYSIATSGIAGPSGGTPEKPVGTTWIAISTPEKTFAKIFSFGEHRERNIIKTAQTALNMLRKEISTD